MLVEMEFHTVFKGPIKWNANSTHITAITRSLKILNSEGAVDKAKVGHFPLFGNSY